MAIAIKVAECSICINIAEVFWIVTIISNSINNWNILSICIKIVTIINIGIKNFFQMVSIISICMNTWKFFLFLFLAL